jgi:hypothetical protein
MADPVREAEEARVINGARAFAARRVESTVRHLRKVAREFSTEYRPINGPEESEKTRRFAAVATAHAQMHVPVDDSPQPVLDVPEQRHRQTPAVDHEDSQPEPVDAVAQSTPVAEPEAIEPEAIEPKTVEPTAIEPTSAPMHRRASDDNEVLEEIAIVFAQISTLTEPPVDEAASQPSTARHAKPSADEADEADEDVTARHSKSPVEAGSDRERLERLLKFVAHQEPGLRWAVGNCADGTTLLVTDLANGWIPSGITLPAGVRLLEPGPRTGNAAALLGKTTLSVTYAPGDSLGWATDYDEMDTSSQPRELPQVDDLGWVLSEATHWRDGLPRMVHTLAKAGAAGTGIVEAEIDLLRVYLDTARYQLLAQYPDADAALLLNCLLLAATEGIASGNLVIANYHFAWFQMLSAPPISGWRANP